jgi:hypothetical protein
LDAHLQELALVQDARSERARPGTISAAASVPGTITVARRA